MQYVNKKILEGNPAERELFDILVLSNNSPESGVRIINSAKHYGKGDPSQQCLIPLEGCRADQAPSASSVANRETGDMRRRGEGILLEPSSLQPYLSHQEVWQHFAHPRHVQAGTEKKKSCLKKTTLNPRELPGGMLI